MNFITEHFKYDQKLQVCGLTPSLIALYINNYFVNNNENVLVLTSNLYEANNYYKMLTEYQDNTLFFPMDDFLTSVAVAISPDFKLKRLNTLDSIVNSKKKHIVITSLMGYLRYLPNKNEKQNLIISKNDQNISREIILEILEKYGYHRESLVTTTGEYAVRGFVIDIFPTNHEHPIRLEFFDEEIESIKSFDENSQLSLDNVQSFQLQRINEEVSDQPSSIMDYLGNETIFLIDHNQIKTSEKILMQEITDYKESKKYPKEQRFMFEFNDIKYNKSYEINSLDLYKNEKAMVYTSKNILNFNTNYDNLKTFCNTKLSNKTIIFAVNNDKQKALIKEIFNDVYVVKDKPVFNKINIIDYKILNGFEFDKYIVIAPYDIENIRNKDIKYKNPIRMGHKIKSYEDMNIGDYIVHEHYGIGIYNGIKTITKGEYNYDYIQLIYADNDKVYVSIDNINRLYKYSSKNGSAPKLDKLNGTSWAKKKLEARKKIEDISDELLELYSSRAKIKTTKFKNYEEEETFAFEFEHELTKDQEKSIKEISYDLNSEAPMDRILCGDVGYGKTEVAFRAMFKTILNNKCVAYLCPTTLLSKQQYDNAKERFKNYPLNIRLLNRYTKPKEVKQIYEELEKGTIDILFGTHKILNDKIKFNNLGLLVIDEEQRFGVKHKEKIKELKNDVNVLTLSATPIPRTLKMAISGLRDLSLIDTPPINRYPIETYVLEENDLIIRDAIYKELARDGQVYLLINDISKIDETVAKIKVLVKEANVVGAYGKMDSNTIDSIMQDFVDKKHNVLVCTTIIETGIDISNVNTIIIIDADRFGLSQLYQIRGRVGRSDKIAYAYLMYKPVKVLTENAVKRLESIKEFTELGSGYKIAMRDLTIRGAGDLLGKEQAGFIEAIGIDLYTRMINEHLNHEDNSQEEDNRKTLNVNSHIDDNYVSDEDIKLEIHKLICSIRTKEDYYKIKEELEDRFGKISEDINLYMLEKCIENYFDLLNITNIIQTKNDITIILPEEESSRVNGEKLFLEVYNIYPKFNLSYKSNRIRINLSTINLPKNYIYYIFDLMSMLYNHLN